MSLIANVTLDIANAIQTLTFTQSAVTVDLITFSSNSMTFSTISPFNLAKSDMIIYLTAMNAFNNTIILNFPSVQNSRLLAFPLSQFNLYSQTVGVKHMYYQQTSNGNTIYNTNYVPIAASAAFAARTSVTISMQEFFMYINMQNIYQQQIALN